MSYIQTLSGKKFNYHTANTDDIDIGDIANSLSNICRFAGHLPVFYSVAQHSVLCSMIVPPEFAFEALMHDAAEAYCQDIPAPLKALLPDYQGVEATVDYLVRKKFALPKYQSPEVKKADLVMLATERRDLGIDDGSKWECLDGITPSHKFCIDPMRPFEAKELFMNRFRELKFGCWADSKIKELVHAGHDVAAELKAECGSVDVRDTAQLIRDLATQLDVTFLALTESERLRKIDSEVRRG